MKKALLLNLLLVPIFTRPSAVKPGIMKACIVWDEKTTFMTSIHSLENVGHLQLGLLLIGRPELVLSG